MRILIIKTLILTTMEDLKKWIQLQINSQTAVETILLDNVILLLNKIDNNLTQFSLTALQAYLKDEMGKKIKQSMRHLYDEQQYLLMLVLYLAVNSKNRGDFVARIVEMEDKIQNSLMCCLKEVEGSFENLLEVKEIVRKVDELEEQNLGLKVVMKETEERRQRLHTHLRSIMEEKKQKLEEVKKERIERATVMELLKSGQDYVGAFLQLKKQTVLIDRHYQMLQRQNDQLRLNKQDNLQKLQQQRIAIMHLESELERYRSLKDQLRSSNISCISNKENYIPHDKITLKSSILISEEDEEEGGLDKILIDLKNEADAVAKRNVELQRKNKKSSEKIKRIHRAMEQLSTKYDKQKGKF